MNVTARILCAISADRPTSISEMWDKMGYDRPVTMNEVLATLRMVESLAEQELVILSRCPLNRINSMRLTPLGAERAREAITGRDRCPECVAAKAKRAERL